MIIIQFKWLLLHFKWLWLHLRRLKWVLNEKMYFSKLKNDGFGLKLILSDSFEDYVLME